MEAASDMEKPCSPAEVRERLDRTENGGVKNSIKNCLTVFRLDDLREVHPARLNTLILNGELWTYLSDLNEQAQERLDTIMEQMKAAEGVTAELKRTRQMEWVQRCNSIHNRAEEIILHEMIYS